MSELFSLKHEHHSETYETQWRQWKDRNHPWKNVYEELVKTEDLTNAKYKVEQILKSHPNSPRANLALATILGESYEAEDLQYAVQICTKILEMSKAEVPDSLFTSTAWLMLVSAHNCNSEEIVEKSASLILQHTRKDSLPHQVLQDAATQMAERLLVTFQIEKAKVCLNFHAIFLCWSILQSLKVL